MFIARAYFCFLFLFLHSSFVDASTDGLKSIDRALNILPTSSGPLYFDNWLGRPELETCWLLIINTQRKVKLSFLDNK